MGPKSVLILGASRYYVRCIEAVRRAGFSTVVVDRNPNSPGFAASDVARVCDITDVDGVMEIARSFGVDGIVPVNDYGVPTAARVSDALGLVGISPAAAELATNKALMRQRWMERGVPCPRVAVADTAEEIRRQVHDVGFPCILKPAHGIGGASRGVVVVSSEADLDEAIAFAHAFYTDKTTLVESFVQADLEHSAEVLVWQGNVSVIAISDKIKTPLPYRVDKSVLYPSTLSPSARARVEMRIREAVLALDITVGAAHVELASTPDGEVLFELGARCGGGGTSEPIVPAVTGVSLFVELARILCGESPEHVVPRSVQACSYHFFTFPPGRVKHIDGLNQVLAQPDVLDAEIFVSPGQDVQQVQTGLQRSGFVIVTGPTQDAVVERGSALEQTIHIEYEPTIPQP